MLLVCVAAIAIVSSIVAMPADKAKAPGPDVPSGIMAPPPPYFVNGYTYDGSGAVLPGCLVNVTNMRTLEYNTTVSDPIYGFYKVDLNAMPSLYLVGDPINVTATKDTAVGWNDSVTTSGPYLWVDVTLSGIIPEFPMVIVPVTGMLAMFTVVILRRRAK